MSIVALPACFNNNWLQFNMNEDALQTEGSSDSFQNFLAQALLPGADLPDVQRAQAAGDSPKSKGVGSNQASGSDTGLRRDVLPGQAAAVNPNVELYHSHPSSAAGSEHTPSADLEPPRGRGRGRGRQRKRVSGQGETAQQRAHRRFYERKKLKLAALEQEAAEKLALYQRLQRENAELRRKYDALKCTIAGRDEQMSLLQAMTSLSINPAVQAAEAAAAPPAAAAALLPGLEMPKAAAEQHHHLALDSPHALQSGPLSSTEEPGVAGSSAHTSLHRRTGSDLTGYMRSQGQLPRHVVAAGPFGAVQLSAQDNLAAAAPVYAWQQPVIKPEEQMLMPQLWPEEQKQQQQQQMLQQDVPNLALTRSISMPARHYPSDRQRPSHLTAVDSPAVGRLDTILQGQHIANPPRAYSSSPLAWQANPALTPEGGSYAQQQQQVLAAAAVAGGAGLVSGWNAGPSRLQHTSLAVPQQQQQQYHPQQQQQQQQVLPQQGQCARPHSWSGPASPTEGSMLAAPEALHRQSQSFPSAAPHSYGSPTLQVMDPALQLGTGQVQHGLAPYQQQQQPKLALGVDSSVAGPSGSLQPARRGFHTITTVGPFPTQQQQLLGRSGSDPTAATHSRQALLSQAQQQVAWQQQQQCANTVNLPVQQQQQQQIVLPMLPPVQQPFEQQQQQQQFMNAGLSDEAYLGQFGSLVEQPDDLMMLDDELMLLLDKELSQQTLPPPQQQQLTPEQSSGMLFSPLDSIPSAGAVFAAQPPGMAGLPQQQQQQQQQPAFGTPTLAMSAAAVPAAQHAPGSPPHTLLGASRLLQARHEAAGYFPAAAAAAGEADFCYVHQLVDWYKGKMQQLAELIPMVDRQVPDVSAGVALVQVVEELIMGCRKFGTRSRVGLWELGLINLETGDFEEAPPNHWRNVYHSLGFSAEIRGKLDGCWGLYKDYMRKAQEERQVVLREMVALEAELDGAAADAGPFAAAIAAGNTGSTSAATSGNHSAHQQQQQRECPASLQFRRDGLDAWQAVLEKLQVSMQREHMVANMIMYSCAQVASHIQMGRAMLNCYPYWPNGPAILAILHEEEQLAAAAAAGRSAWPEPPSRMRSI